MAHGVGIGLNIYAGAGGGAATGSNAELEGETQGFVFVGTSDGVLVSVKDTTTPANNRSNVDINAVTSPVTQSGTSPKLVLGPDGLYHWTPHNLLLYSGDPTNVAAWSTANGASSVGVNDASAPDGTLTAHTITATGANADRYNGALSIAGPSYTTNVWLKRKTGTGDIQVFTLDGIGRTTVPVTSAWTAFPVTAASTGTNVYLGIRIATPGDAVYLWHPQVNRGTTALAYHATTATAWVAVPVEYDPVRAEYYVLAEPQATNLLWPSKPTGWGVGGSASTVNNDAIAPDGTLTATKLTLTAPSDYYYGVFSGATPLAAYMPSIFIKRVSTTGTIAIQNPNDGGQGSWTIDVSLLPDAWTRIERGHPAITGTAANFTVHASGGGGILLIGIVGTVVAHIWHGQCELGSVASSPIPTFAATVTRADDNINVATSAIPFVPATNTVIADLRAIQPAIGTQQLWEFFANGGNRTGSSVSSLGVAGVGNVSGGGFSGGIVNIGTLLANIRSKVGATYAANDFAGTVDAGTVATGTGTLPVTAPTTLYIGTEGPNWQVIAGKFRAFKYIPRRMSNAQLQIETLLSEDGGQLILLGEQAGLGIDFTYSTGLGSVAVKGHTTNLDNVPVDSFLTNAGTSPKMVLGRDGLYHWTAHNLFTRSEALDQADWVKTDVTITANAANDQDGAATLDKIVEAATTNFHYLLGSPTTTIGDAYTASAVVKAGERTWAWMWHNALASVGAYFDLANGVVGSTVGVGTSSTITALGGGLYRITMTYVAVSGGILGFGPALGDATPYYAGDVTKGIYAGKFQINRGTTALAYLPTTTTARAGVPMEYSGGGYYALVEPQATNLALGSRAFSDAAYWSQDGLTVAANQVAGPDASLVADKLTDTTSLAYHRVFSANLTAAPSAIYTFSVFLKYIDHRYVVLVQTDGGSYGIVTCDLLTGTITEAINTVAATISAVGGGWYRVTCAYTNGPAATFVQASVWFNNAPTWSGNQYAGTGTSCYVSDAQLELGSVATSPIPTGAATVTRAADWLNVATSAFPYLNSAGTLITQVRAAPVDEFGILAWFNTHDFDNSWGALKSNDTGTGAGSHILEQMYDGGLTVLDLAATANDGGYHKVAHAFDATDTVGVVDGSTLVTGIDRAPIPTRLNIGGRDNGLTLNGRFRTFTYAPRRMTNAELETKTALTPATGAQLLLAGEANGMALDFTTALGTVAVRDVATPANVKNNLPVDAFLTQSGTSPKLVMGSDGVYRWSPHNMIAQSETLTGAGWFPIGVTVTVNAAASPTTGAMTVDRMVENTSDLTHNIWSPYFTAVAGTRYTASFIAKADGGSLVEAMIWSADGSLGISVGYDLSTGTGSAPVSPFGWTEAASSITALGSGWYRITVSGIPTVGSALSGVLAGFVGNHTGNPLAGMFVGEFQVNRGAVPTTYMATTTVARYGVPIEYGNGAYYALVEPQVTNLIVRNDHHDDGAYWSLVGTTVSLNAAVGPDGLTQATSLVETVGGSLHLIQQTPAASPSTAYTVSVYLKPNGRTAASIQINNNPVDAAAVAFFNLTGSGAAKVGSDLIVGFTGKSASIQALANGWYRCTFTFTTTATTFAFIAFVGTSTDYAAESRTHTGDGVSGLYLWLVQAELGSVATSPIPTGAATVTRAADNIASAAASFPVGAANSMLIDATRNAADYGSPASLAVDSGAEFFGYRPDVFGWIHTHATVYQGGTGVPVYTSGRLRTAARNALNDGRAAGDGTLGAVLTPLAPAVPNKLYVGQLFLGGYSVTSPQYIHRVVAVPRAWSDAELQTKSAP